MKITLYPKYLIRSMVANERNVFFKEGYKLLYPECVRLGMTPWQHYVMDGKRKGFDNGNHPSERAFFAEGYETEYPDIKASGVDPWKHYAEKGYAEGRDNGFRPTENQFFAEGYLLMYPDVRKAGIDPWRHYVLNGRKEGRDNGLHPTDNQFFAEGYLEMYPDVRKAGIDPWRHYVLNGRKEGRDNGFHPADNQFFAEGYLFLYPDVRKAGTDPWRHYVLNGKKEGRDNGLHPSERLFHADRYLLNNPKVKKTRSDAWRHYVLVARNVLRTHEISDFYIRLSGHEQELVRTVYLAQHKQGGEAKKRSHRCLLIGHDFLLSGASICLSDIAQILVSDGYSVDIAVRGHNAVSLCLYDGIGADVFLIPDSTECFPGADRIVKSYDLVIVNTIIMAAYAELCRKMHIPHLWFVHEDVHLIQNYFDSIRNCKQRFFDDCENIICVSKLVTDGLYSKYGINFKYINNFIKDINPAMVGDISEKEDVFVKRVKTFAVVGPVETRKSQETAVAAFLSISVSPRYKGKWKLFFIGRSGQQANEPRLGMKLESVTKNIHDIVWCGQVTENKWELFKSIDFFIVPSLEESSSKVVIEAAMLGKPVITTTHVGAKYLAENNGGFLFEPGDTASLRNLITRCLDMTGDEYMNMSRRIRANYEKTSSLPIYHKALSSSISDALKRFNAEPGIADGFGDSDISLRAMGSGRNVFCSSKFAYFKFANFEHLVKQSATVTSANSARAEHVSYVGVVVPVFNGLRHLKVLLPSLFKNTDLPHKFIFVDDCSDAETADFLTDSLKARHDCILLRNDNNLGFVRSINKGADKALESCSNFVMLNSDTEVPSGWLGRLMKPIFENEEISSVTPMSNRATIFSYPFFFFDAGDKNDLFLKKFGLEGINKAIRNSAIAEYIDIPTGHGFCMAVSGKAWKEIGGLNAELFGRGYGEENEWSLRAALSGFRNVLVPTLYVAHHDNGSFSSEEKQKNCASAQEILSVYHKYRKAVDNFKREQPQSDSVASILISLALQAGYKPELFADQEPFVRRMSGKDGIFILNIADSQKVSIKLLGQTILIGNCKGLEKTGIFC